jgi:competence protein ComEA
MNLFTRNTFRSLLLSLALAFASFGAVAADAVNINTADAATLATALNGIGQSKAEAIVAYRESNGPFKSVDQLADVKGVGLKTVDKNRTQMTVGGTAQPARTAAATAKSDTP